MHTEVAVQAQGRGPLADMLSVVAHSPIAALATHALDHAKGSGQAELQLKLALPVSQIHASRVQGSVAFSGSNEVQITPDAPVLSRVRGAVQFSDTGFTLAGVRAQALGGEVRLEGGMRGTDAPVQVRAQGLATAEGLRQAHELGLLARLAQHASGSTPYQFALTVRRGVPELQITTALQGMALELPAPLNKKADATQPLRFDKQLTREAAAPGSKAPLQDLLTLDLGALGKAQYLRDLGGAQPQVLRGSISVGAGEAPDLPAAGVAANARLDHIDVDAWEKLAEALAGSTQDTPTHAMQEYLPTRLALRADQVTLDGRTLHNLVVGATQNGGSWQASLDARELSGHVQYHPGSVRDPAGRLHARLTRLALPQSSATAVDKLLDEQPRTLPALDIVVQDFELGGRHLGQLEIEAQNRGGGDHAPREWRLAKFNLRTPEAQFTGSGNWALLTGEGARHAPERRTVMNMRLDINDAGELLGRLGMPGVVRKGKGRLEGQVAWLGSPLNPDYHSMTGQLHIDMESGQFLKADPGLAKLLGVLSLQSLPRRLTLDFRDVFSEGFSFDFVRGDVRVERGVAFTNNLQMKGVNAAVLMEGQADIQHETQSLHVVVVPEVNAMTASLVATAINPVIGLGSFLARCSCVAP